MCSLKDNHIKISFKIIFLLIAFYWLLFVWSCIWSSCPMCIIIPEFSFRAYVLCIYYAYKFHNGSWRITKLKCLKRNTVYRSQCISNILWSLISELFVTMYVKDFRTNFVQHMNIYAKFQANRRIFRPLSRDRRTCVLS